MKITTKTIKRGNIWKTEYRIDSVYLDTYGMVSGVIDELNSIVEMFPEELRSEVMMDMESDSSYATFWVEGIASNADAEKAAAKDKAAKAKELERAIRQQKQLEATIQQLTKAVSND